MPEGQTDTLDALAAAEGGEPQQPEPQAQEPPQGEPHPQAPEQTQAPEEQGPPDVSEQLAALSRDVQALAQGRQPGQVDPDQDLYDQLAGSPADPGYDSQEGQHQQQAPGEQPQEQTDPFEELIRERVAEATYPILMGIETDRRRSRLESIAEAHPELRQPEFQDAIADRLQPLADRYGNEMILTDPDLIEQNLLAILAQRASAGEVPAEQAAARGGNIERNAGASAPAADRSPEDQIKQGIMGKDPRAGSAFL
jgi:hypothetical protein